MVRTWAGIGLTLALAACTPPSPSPSASGSAAPSASVEPTPDMSAYSGLWVDATSETIGTTAEYTNRVELADVNGDQQLDILFANGGDYETPAPEPAASRVFLNQGPDQPFLEAPDMLRGLTGYTRVIKVRDLNADGFVDIVLGTTYQTQTQLLLGGDAGYTRATGNLPQLPLSVGDLEVGDVDADGDLDLALADWGPGSPMESIGGQVHLWLNDGAGRFTEATAAAMPTSLVRFSWDLEFIDVDNDWDLDLAISSKRSSGSFLFVNDGTGKYTDVSAASLPQFPNNYEFEPMDLDGDGYLDLVTVNDGPDPAGEGLEHVFANNADGTFRNATPDWWPDASNISADDNAEIFLDVDSDGDADFLLFSLNGPDRLLVNDGTGHLTVVVNAIDAGASRGSLGLALGDLNGDGRLDIVESQGEVPGAFEERVYLATSRMPPDTAAPHLWTDLDAAATGSVTVHARVTDGLSPWVPGHPAEVYLTWGGDAANHLPLAWYGEYLFRTSVEIPDGATDLQLCAVDRYDNLSCTGA